MSVRIVRDAAHAQTPFERHHVRIRRALCSWATAGDAENRMTLSRRASDQQSRGPQHSAVRLVVGAAASVCLSCTPAWLVETQVGNPHAQRTRQAGAVPGAWLGPALPAPDGLVVRGVHLRGQLTLGQPPCFAQFANAVPHHPISLSWFASELVLRGGQALS